jgi:hypothetical protein
MRNRQRQIVALALGIALVVGCAKPVQPDGYRPGVVPGASEAAVLQILGKPSERVPLTLGNVRAEALTYPFGQVILQSGSVVAVTVASDPSFVGPAGITLGMPESQVRKDLLSDRKRRVGHKDSYDLVVGSIDTRTRDIYDETDHAIIEMAAANPNDPEAPFNVIGITLANAAGMSLMTAITQAKVSGNYSADQHVVNFVSDPWHT